MRLTENFTMWEFTRTRHSDLQQKNIDEATRYLHNILKVAVELQKLRDFTFRRVKITSGFRYPELNLAVGSKAKNSQHIVGEAADFTVEDFSDPQGLRFIFDWCRHNLNFGQLIYEHPEGEQPWIHLGLPRPGREKTAYYYNGKDYKKVEDKNEKPIVSDCGISSGDIHG